MLLRAGEPLEGLAGCRARRGRDAVRDLCSGPGRFSQALGLDRADDGLDLVAGASAWIGPGARSEEIRTGPRVGIHETERSWRYWRGQPLRLPREAGTSYGASPGDGVASGDVHAIVFVTVDVWNASVPGAGSWRIAGAVRLHVEGAVRTST